MLYNTAQQHKTTQNTQKLLEMHRFYMICRGVTDTCGIWCKEFDTWVIYVTGGRQYPCSIWYTGWYMHGLNMIQNVPQTCMYYLIHMSWCMGVMWYRGSPIHVVSDTQALMHGCYVTQGMANTCIIWYTGSDAWVLLWYMGVANTCIICYTGPDAWVKWYRMSSKHVLSDTQDLIHECYVIHGVANTYIIWYTGPDAWVKFDTECPPSIYYVIHCRLWCMG